MKTISLILVLFLVSLGYSQPIQPSMPRRTGGGATFLVAASNAPTIVKTRADYRCDGIADNVQIQAAHDALDVNVGGKIILSEGQFNITVPLQFNRMMALEGQTSASTIIFLTAGSDCNMIELGDCVASNPLSAFRHFKLDGNKANNVGKYGIIQNIAATNKWVDIQIEDVWFNEMDGPCVSLQEGWDHRIVRCPFENSSDAAIELNVTTAGLTSIWITDNYTISIPQFIKIGTADAGKFVNGLVIQGNHASSGGTAVNVHFVELPPVKFLRMNNNFFYPNFGTDNTYAIFKHNWTTMDVDIYDADIIITNNTFRDGGANKSKYGIWIQPYTISGKQLENIVITGNIIEGPKTYAIMSSDVAFRYWRYAIITNNLIEGSGSGIYLKALYYGLIENNFINSTGSYSIEIESVVYNTIFQNNYCAKPIKFNVLANGMMVEGNVGPGVNETVTTGSPTLQTWNYTKLDSNGGVITATLSDIAGSAQGDLNPIGQIKTIVMTDANNSSTVSVTNHETSDPEVGTFDAIDEIWVLMWSGTEWITIKATCTF